MSMVGEASQAEEEQDEKPFDESGPVDPAALEAAKQAMLSRTTDRDMTDAEKEMERLLGMYPKDFQIEMCLKFGEAAFNEGH